MDQGYDPDRRIIRLIDAAEATYPFVSLERIRGLLRASAPVRSSTRGLRGWFQRAVADGLLLSDSRLRLRRDGDFEPIQVYRLNRRHPDVAGALEPGLE